MIRADSSETPQPPTLAELMARYLRHQADAHAAGLAPAEAAGDVVPYEAAPVQPVDPCLAWNEAVAAVRYCGPAVDPSSWPVPPEWTQLVADQEPLHAAAFALGNYPQLVRQVRPLLNTTDLTTLRPEKGRTAAVPALTNWAAGQTEWPQVLLGLGLLRLAGQFDAADALRRQHSKAVPEAWRPAWANEEAALLWHRGQADEAAAGWAQQAESVPVCFNRGLAALFLGKTAEARTWLRKVAEQLPETEAWHHLAQMYLALAEMRG